MLYNYKIWVGESVLACTKLLVCVEITPFAVATVQEELL